MNKKQLLLLLMLVAAIGGAIFALRALRPQTATTNKLPVTASFYPMAEFARQVGGDKVEVRTLVRPGLEPHDYEPTPQEIASLHKAKLFIYNGAGFEPWVSRVNNTLKDSQVVKVEASSGTQLLSVVQEDNDQSAHDPHVWLDPVQAQKQVQNIRDGLVQVDPLHKTHYETRAAKFMAELAELDAAYTKGLSQCASRTIVTTHQAFRYVAAHYNLQMQPITGLSPEEEPSPQKLAEIAQYIKAHSVHYIFFESLVSPKLAQTIAQETGAQTLALNPLEGLTDAEVNQGKGYLSLQKDNLQNLRLALDCK